MNYIPILFYIVSILSAYFAQHTFPSFFIALLVYMVLLCIGIQSVWLWFIYSFRADSMAESFGVQRSYFQFEMAYAYLAFAITGVLAYFLPFLIPGVVLSFSLLSLMIAFNHIKQILKGVRKPGIFGVKLITDILIPLTLLISLWNTYLFLGA